MIDSVARFRLLFKLIACHETGAERPSSSETVWRNGERGRLREWATREWATRGQESDWAKETKYQQRGLLNDGLERGERGKEGETVMNKRMREMEEQKNGQQEGNIGLKKKDNLFDDGSFGGNGLRNVLFIGLMVAHTNQQHIF